MTTTFRTAGAWGAGKGADLTPAEVDNNFYDKETRITAIEAAGVAVGISSITVSGDQMTITMTDSSIQGPFTLPTVQWTAGGAWAPSTLYQALTVLTYGGSAYLVTIDHTSDTTFDPNALSGTQQIYELLWSFAPAAGFEITTATFTPDLVHANCYIRLTNAAGCTVTIDPAVEYPAWTELHFRDESTDTGAAVDFLIDSPGVINPVLGCNDRSTGTGSVVTLKRVGTTDAWDIMGRLEQATI